MDNNLEFCEERHLPLVLHSTLEKEEDEGVAVFILVCDNGGQ